MREEPMLIIDRFEGDFAVVEADGKWLDIPKSLLPPDAARGDILKPCSGRYTIDKALTKARREEIQKRMEELFSSDEERQETGG